MISEKLEKFQVAKFLEKLRVEIKCSNLFNERNYFANEIFEMNLGGYECNGEKPCLFGLKSCEVKNDIESFELPLFISEFDCEEDPYFIYRGFEDGVVMFSWVGEKDFHEALDAIGFDNVEFKEYMEMVNQCFESVKNN